VIDHHNDNNNVDRINSIILVLDPLAAATPISSEKYRI